MPSWRAAKPSLTGRARKSGMFETVETALRDVCCWRKIGLLGPSGQSSVGGGGDSLPEFCRDQSGTVVLGTA